MAISVGVGPGWRAEKRQPQKIADSIIAVFRIVEQAEAVLSVSQIGPTERRDFELCFLEAVAACGGTSDGAVGNLGGCGIARGGKRERRLQQHMRFVPIDQHLRR